MIGTEKEYAVRLEKLSIYRGGRALYRNFSADIEKGSVTAILAPSGSGKTTLLECIAGLIRPDGGRVLFAENGSAGAMVSFLFQEPRLLPWHTIENNVLLPLRRIMPPAEAAARSLFFIEKSGMEKYRHSFPDALSGGERQRAALARAFAYPSSVLLLDEAFQSQDLRQRLRLMSLTEGLLAAERRTVLLVTHDVREALCLASRCIVLGGEPLSVLMDNPVSPPHEDSVFQRYFSPYDLTLRIERLLTEQL